MKIWDEGQTIEMRIPPKRNGIPRIYNWTRRGQDRLGQDTSHLGLDVPQENPEIQCFLGFCNFYRRFIEGSSRTAKPLYARTKKECIGNWEWGDKEQQAFHELRTKLTTAPGLVYFDPLAPTKIETEASKYVWSGILSQQCQERQWRPVAYRSKTMSDAECNYDIHDKELLAIVQAFHEWKRYTRGDPKPILVLTEHNNLVTFMTTKELNERQE